MKLRLMGEKHKRQSTCTSTLPLKLINCGVSTMSAGCLKRVRRDQASLAPRTVPNNHKITRVSD
jgi:hypothetical protein